MPPSGDSWEKKRSATILWLNPVAAFSSMASRPSGPRPCCERRSLRRQSVACCACPMVAALGWASAPGQLAEAGAAPMASAAMASHERWEGEPSHPDGVGRDTRL